MIRPALRRRPQPRAGLLGIGLLPWLAACAFHGPYEVREVWADPVAPVYVAPAPPGLLAFHGDVTLVFDRELGCHRLVGRPDHYFLHDQYYRYQADHWEVSARADGPWRRGDRGRVPESLRRRYDRPPARHATSPAPAPPRERPARGRSPERLREPEPVREPERVREPEQRREAQPTSPARVRAPRKPRPTRVAREESREAPPVEVRHPGRDRPSSEVADLRPGGRARRAVKGR